MTARLPATVALLSVSLAVAGCASTSDEARRTSLAALATPPAAAPATTTPRTRAPARCSDPTASLRPPAVMPRPGAMPPGSVMARIRRRGRLVAGVDQNTLLFAYLRPSTARIEGFEVDLLREVARAIFGDPNKIELKALTTTQRLPAVESGAVDIVADAVTVTCERRRQVAFSTVYYDANQRLLVPAGSKATSIADLHRKGVCATKGSTTLQRIKSDKARPIPFPVEQRTDCLVALQEGRVSAISSDDAILLGFKAQDPNTKIIGPSLAPEPYGMAIARNHPDFVRFVNGVLARVRSDGAWKAIYRRWLGPFAPTPSPPRPRYDG
jgi:polar amino acid transport system substrate-binding protein